jgi:hypothetical protein
MTRRRALLLPLCLVGCAAPPAGVLSVFSAPDAPAPGALRSGAVTLALGGLPSGDAQRISDELAAATRSAIRRANPLYVELAEPAPATPLSANLPALTAAANLLGSPWQAPGLSVELGPTCRPDAQRCIPVFRERLDDGVERRARGMAWAFSNAALLRAPGRVEQVRDALQQRAIQPDSNIALVFTSSSGSLDAASLGALQREATRALRYLPEGARERFWLEALAQPSVQWALPVQLNAEDLLVVPRLGALARVPEFVGEIRGTADAEWVLVPTQG